MNFSTQPCAQGSEHGTQTAVDILHFGKRTATTKNERGRRYDEDYRIDCKGEGS